MPESLLTFILMFVILSVSGGDGREKLLSGIIIGGVIGLEALFAGPVSGASMNPARSLAPVIVSLHLGSLWIYLVAPFVGAMASIPLYHCIYSSSCCGYEASEERS